MFRLQRLEITGFKSFADYTEVIFTGDGITAVVGPNGCGKCLEGSTLVTLSDGREIEIRHLVESALADAFFKEQFDDGLMTRENPHDIQILSLNPESLKLEPRKVSAFIKRETTEKLLFVRTRAGREIKATPYHPLFTLENGELRALRADELRVGLRVAVPRVLPTTETEIKLNAEDYLPRFAIEDRIFMAFSDALRDWTEKNKNQFGSLGKWTKDARASERALQNLRRKQSVNVADVHKLAQASEFPFPFSYQIKSRQNGFLKLPARLNPKLARFLGLLVAEGRNTYSSQVWFVNSDEKINQEFENLGKDLFDVEAARKNYKPGAADSLIFSQSLCKTLERVFNFPINSNSFEKEIPSQVFRARAETKWAFLSGLFEGDAYVCSRPQKSNGKVLNYIEFVTASEKLAGQVVSLLLQLGVFAYLRPKRKYAANTEARRVRDYYSVLIYGSKQLNFAAHNLTFVGEKQAELEKLKNIPPADNPNRDLIPTAAEIVREAAKLAGVKIKPNRKKYPKLAAYTGKMCEASRKGLAEVVGQIRQLSEDYQPAATILEKLSVLSDSDVYWDEIVSVEEIEPADPWVYDLSVDETHNFVAGNIIVHNSNVSESIAWVLGEQRAKALRGAEMQDVIFQGTNKRQPSGMAEVVLHLVRDEEAFFEDDESELSDIDEALGDIDERAVNVEDFEPEETATVQEISANGNGNGHHPPPPPIGKAENGFHAVETTEMTATAAISNPTEGGAAALTVQPKARPKRHWRPRRLALDFAPGESVSVTRRLYRSGESEYLLNGKTCRLRDIQDLFSGTGLSGAHYAIIEQGRIGQILSAKPSDRRTLIEEAAGISKFRTRQRAAETRLESAKTNLRRISDIVEEVEKQANSLRRQAAKTRRYKILKEELREMLRQVFAAEGSYLSELVEELETKLEEAIKTERELFAEVAVKDEAFRAATREAREAEERLSDLRAGHAENALQRDRAERDLQYKREQLTNLEKRGEILKGEIEATRQRLKLIKAEAERLAKDERRERGEAERHELALRQAEGKYQAKIGELRQIEAELEKTRAEVFQHATAAERLAEIARQHENTIERLTERAEGLKREGERAEQNFAEHVGESEKLERELAAARENQKKLHEEKRALSDAAAGAREILKTAEKELTNLREQFSRARHRLESLRELEERRAVYAPAVQRLFAEQKKIGVRFLGTLADNLNVEPQAEKAVENVFGAFLQSILVESEEDARKTLAYLNEHKLGRISVLVSGQWSVVSGQKKRKPTDKRQQITDKLLNFLGASDDFAELLSEIFPRETAAKMVEDFEKIKAKADEIFVSGDGDLMIAGKLFVGGKAGGNEKSSSLLAFKRELRELEGAGERLKKEIEKAEKEAEKARRNLSEKEDKIVDLQSYIVKFEREMLSQEIQARTLKQEIERAERHKRVVADEIRQIERELEEIRARRAEAETNARKAEKARAAAEENLEKISKKLTDARERVESENADLNEKRTAAGIAAERRRSVASSLRRVETEAAELESRLARQNLEIGETETNHQNLTAAIAEIAAKIETARDAELSENEEIAAAAENLKIARERADAMSAELADLNRRSAEARNERAELEVRQAETVTRLKNLNEICAHELNQSLVELVETVEVEEDFDLDAAHKQTDDLRRRIESFGAVNMLALEELSETEERLLFLTSQRQDIVDGIAAAEEALREIKQRSRERFRHAFEAINEYFREFFLELFGGGRGEMTLLDAEDVLESGIEIVAQPPGRRLQNILLLSGGEKAMTAIALVMAIFKYRPSPFCLLDEVDAPLDDANVGRFVDKIAEMSEKTQFIVITHNKRTMEAARALYGVTMEEPGVSKVVSVRFE